MSVKLPHREVLLISTFLQEVIDESDGCGAKFSVTIVSSAFEGKSLIHRHRSVHSILEEELKTIHAFKQKTLTPAEWEKKEMTKRYLIINSIMFDFNVSSLKYIILFPLIVPRIRLEKFKMIQFKVSAPGKVILFGEHAVVYGKTAVAASVDLRTVLNFAELPETEQIVKICFPKVNLFINVPLQQIQNFFFINKDVEHVENYEAFYNKVKEFVSIISYGNLQQRLSLEAFFYLFIYITQKEEIEVKPFQVHLNTELGIGSGLGSSSSFAVCLAACFLHWSRLQKNVYKILDFSILDTISKYALNCEKIMHGNPSGIDNSVCTYGSIIEFKKDDYVKPISNVHALKILLVDTRVNRSTRVLVERLLELKHRYPVIIDLIMSSIDNISKEVIKIIEKLKTVSTDDEYFLEGYRQLMILINMNQGLLATCQVSHPSLDRICAEAQNYALAAKLTGAGGGGHAYILLLPDTQPETIASISRKLIADGFTVKLTTLGGPGVQIN